MDLCVPHDCHCGSLVDARGLHSFVCKKAPGRTARHHTLNDLVALALSQPEYQSLKSRQGYPDLTENDQTVFHSSRG